MNLSFFRKCKVSGIVLFTNDRLLHRRVNQMMINVMALATIMIMVVTKRILRQLR